MTTTDNSQNVPDVVASDYCGVSFYCVAGSGEYSLHPKRSGRSGWCTTSNDDDNVAQGWDGREEKGKVDFALKFATAYGFKIVQLIQQNLLKNKKHRYNAATAAAAIDNIREVIILLR